MTPRLHNEVTFPRDGEGNPSLVGLGRIVCSGPRTLSSIVEPPQYRAERTEVEYEPFPAMRLICPLWVTLRQEPWV